MRTSESGLKTVYMIRVEIRLSEQYFSTIGQEAAANER